MDFNDYRRHDAVGLAALVARREVSGTELLATATARMAEVNPKINAVVQDLTSTARTQTAEPGPFSGVPFLVKDLGISLAGTPTTGGSKLFETTVATADSALGAAYRGAGLTIFGKTNTPEFGLWPFTESDLGRGRGRNRAGRSRQRWRRLDPDSGILLWSFRPQALARTGLVCARRRRVGRCVDAPCRDPLREGLCGPSGCRLSPTARRPLFPCAARAALCRGGRARARPAENRVHGRRDAGPRARSGV